MLHKLLLVGALGPLASLSLLGEDIFISQGALGSDTGISCADAHSIAWINVPENWGDGLGRVGPGDTVHLCGSFVGKPGETLVTVQGNGTAGSPITILFESDAAMTAPYWGGQYHGAIDIIGRQYVVIDGGRNGIIRNTSNGTARAYRQASQGVFINRSNDIAIRNLSILDIYANGGANPDASDTAGSETNNIRVVGTTKNLTLQHNRLSSARAGIRMDFSGSALSNIVIRNNLITDHCWGIVIGAGTGGETTTGIDIYNNEFTDWLNWQCPAQAAYCTNKTDAYHTDGVILYAPRGSPISATVRNNYFHGSLGAASPTAYIYCTMGGGSSGFGSTCKIYNNLFIEESGRKANWMVSTGRHTANHEIYNNTLIGQDNTGGVAFMLSGSAIRLRNNVVSGKKLGVATYEQLPPLNASDNNVWHNLASENKFAAGDGATWYTLTQWQALGFDIHSTTNSPQLSALGLPGAGSSAHAIGANLTALGIESLNTDKSGAARPPGGAWDAGAYQMGLVVQPPLRLEANEVR